MSLFIRTSKIDLHRNFEQAKVWIDFSMNRLDYIWISKCVIKSTMHLYSQHLRDIQIGRNLSSDVSF